MSDGRRSNAGLAARLVLMAAGSFAFGFALVPLYDVVREVTGIGSRDRLSRAGSAEGQLPVEGRTVRSWAPQWSARAAGAGSPRQPLP